MAHAFDAAIVEIDVRYLKVLRKAVGDYREPVIVRSDFHPAMLQVLHRLVPPSMPEGKLERITAKRTA